MQTQAGSDFKFIMVYQKHFTVFVTLRPLKSMQAQEVAYYLLNMFTRFEASYILNGDNDK